MVMTTATTTHPYDLTPGAMLFGHLRLQQTLGRGLYRVLDVLTHRPYVLVIAGPSDREFTRRRVHHVGIALAGESLPGIGSITETASFGEWAYTLGAMPEGTVLRERLDSDRLLPRAELRDLARGVFNALVHAHDRGIFHGALTPSCIVLQENQSILVGFSAPSEGADQYTSPEVRMGRTPTASDDLFSAGTILTECSGLSVQTATTPITHAALAVLQRLTAPQRENRYPDARTAATAFDAVFAAGIETPKPISKLSTTTAPVPPSKVITEPLPVPDLPTKGAVEQPEEVEIGPDSVTAAHDANAVTAFIPLDDDASPVTVDVNAAVSNPFDTRLTTPPDGRAQLETAVLPSPSENNVKSDQTANPLPSTSSETSVLPTPVISAPFGPPPAAPEPELATLNVKLAGEPHGASVFWDGRRVGVLPVTLKEGRRGQHLLAVEASGYIRQELGVNLQSDLEMGIGLVPIPSDSATQELPEDFADLVGKPVKKPHRGWGVAALLAGLAVLGGGLAFSNPPAVVTGLTTTVGAFGSLVLR